MNQTLAIFIDAYRELNAKKLFWITMILSGLVVAAMAILGINEKGLTVLWYEIPIGGDLARFTTRLITEETFYKLLFVGLGLNLWLAWIATILALVSTASIIPDFVSSGSVELSLSKPIGRVRLFLTKYAAGTLFAGLQVLVFSSASFLVLGLRAGVWEPGLFLAVPLMVLFFSYLYCISALVGLITRSTITALLVTLLCWFFFFALNSADQISLVVREETRQRAAATERQIERMEKNTTEKLAKEASAPVEEGRPSPPQPGPDGTFTREQLDAANPFLAGKRRELDESRSAERLAQRWQSIFFAVKTVVPKTQETVGLTERWLVDAAELETLAANGEEERGGDEDEQTRRESAQAGANSAERIIRERPVAWVIGTSMGFQVVLLTIACVIFARRDF